MPSIVREDQIPPIRVPRLLRRELEAAALEEGRSLTAQVRWVLLSFAERRLAEREELAA